MQKALHLAVGSFVLLGLLALVFLALKVSNTEGMTSGAAPYTVRAYFDQIGGLKQGAAVRSAGVLVGRVASIRLDSARYQAEVTLELDPAVPFPKDSSAQILTSGLLGENYVGLAAGADLDNLKAGDQITLTQSAVVLEQLISQFLYNRDSSGGGSSSEQVTTP